MDVPVQRVNTIVNGKRGITGVGDGQKWLGPVVRGLAVVSAPPFVSWGDESRIRRVRSAGGVGSAAGAAVTTVPRRSVESSEQRRSGCVQRPPQLGNQVAPVLHAYREPHQGLGDAVLR